MKWLFALLLTTVTTFVHSQSKIFVIKTKGSGSGKCDILMNNQFTGTLKGGAYIESQVSSAGPITIGIANPSGASNGMPKGLVINIENNIDYYLLLSTNSSYRQLLKKVSKYEGQRILNSSNYFSKKDFKTLFVEDLNQPLIKNNIQAQRATQNKEHTTTTRLVGLPNIEIISPVKSDEVFKTELETFEVKGKTSSPSSINSISINGITATVNDLGYFSAKIKLSYLDNDISIVAFTKDGRFTKSETKIYRAYSQLAENANKRSGKDYALLFATNQYDEHSNLTNPIFDAKRIQEELTNLYGFETLIIENATLQTLLITLKNFSKREFSEDDQLFIFIAGHGEYDNIFGEGYVVCKDSKKDDEARSSYMSHSNLRTIINNIQCKHILLSMDVCFGGTFDPVIAHRGSSSYTKTDNITFIKRKMKYTSRLYITSGGKEYVPDGAPGHHSPFAKNFIQALVNLGGTDNILTFNEIQRYVEKTTPEPRVGNFGDNQPGSDFLFIAK